MVTNANVIILLTEKKNKEIKYTKNIHGHIFLLNSKISLGLMHISCKHYRVVEVRVYHIEVHHICEGVVRSIRITSNDSLIH